MDELSPSPTIQRRAFVGLGSNLDAREDFLVRALQTLRRIGGVELRVLRVSSLYETAPQGPVTDQPLFYNAVVELETRLTPQALLRKCQWVETLLGRERTVPKGPRTIDLDLLLMDDLVVDEPQLTVPHPELSARAFALVPLLELAPMTVDPRNGALLCRFAGQLLNSQPIVQLGSLPGYPAKLRLPAYHLPSPQETGSLRGVVGRCRSARGGPATLPPVRSA